MFEAINSVDSGVIKKSEEQERNMLVTEYNKALETLDIESFLRYRVKQDANIGLHKKGSSYLMANYTFKKDLEEVESNIEKYKLLDHRESLFNMARRNIMEAGNFLRARKLLNMARRKGFFCNTLYELEKLLCAEWRPEA